MRKLITFSLTLSAAALLLASSTSAQQTPAATTSQTAPAAKPAAPKTAQTPAKKPVTPFTLKTQKDKVSYAIGVNIGSGMKKGTIDVDPAIVSRGIRDAFAGNKLLLTDAEITATLKEVETTLRKKQQEEAVAQQALAKKVGDENKRQGDAFLAENKTKEGVVTLPSGLQYKIIQAGTGPKPTAADTVLCNYRGTLIDGSEFDSTAKHGGQPLEIPVSHVIKGWTEALQLMPVGSKWQLFIPPDLAYGERGPGGANSTLIFDVELVSIKPKETVAPGATPPQGSEKPQASSPQ